MRIYSSGPVPVSSPPNTHGRRHGSIPLPSCCGRFLRFLLLTVWLRHIENSFALTSFYGLILDRPIPSRIDSRFGLLLFGAGLCGYERNDRGGGAIMTLKFECVQVPAGTRLHTTGMGRGDDHDKKHSHPQTIAHLKTHSSVSNSIPSCRAASFIAFSAGSFGSNSLPGGVSISNCTPRWSLFRFMRTAGPTKQRNSSA